MFSSKWAICALNSCEILIMLKDKLKLQPSKQHVQSLFLRCYFSNQSNLKNHHNARTMSHDFVALICSSYKIIFHKGRNKKCKKKKKTICSLPVSVPPRPPMQCINTCILTSIALGQLSHVNGLPTNLKLHLHYFCQYSAPQLTLAHYHALHHRGVLVVVL